MQVEPLTEDEAAELAALADDGNKRAQPITRVRPGHADLAGALKYGFNDVRNVLERSSARETTARVAAGGVARAFLRELGIEVWSFTAEVGGVALDPARATRSRDEADASPLRCPDPDAETAMIARIDEARSNGDTVGGVFEVVVHGAPIGLGSYVHWDRRLDAALAAAVMSINIVKGVEIGLGFEQTRRFGSQVHDVIEGRRDDGTWIHRSNNAGGLTGGVTNGEPIVVRGAVKPISTLARPLPTADLVTGEPVEKAHYERSDICVVPAAGVDRRGDGDADARPVRAREDRRRLDGRGRSTTCAGTASGSRPRPSRRRRRPAARPSRAARRPGRPPSPTPARPAPAGTTDRRWTSCSSGCRAAARAPSGGASRPATARRSSTSTSRSSARPAARSPRSSRATARRGSGASSAPRSPRSARPTRPRRSRRVISPGGGAIVDPRNRWPLFRGRLPVWLDVRPEVLAQRLRRSPNVRPLVQGGDPMGRIRQLAARPRAVLRGGAPGQRRRRDVGRRRDASTRSSRAGMPSATTLLRATTKIGDGQLGEGIAGGGRRRRRSGGSRRGARSSSPSRARGPPFGEGLADGAARATGWPVETVLLPEGEAAKRLSVIEDAARELARLRVERREPLVAVGGGALGDPAGFLAATYLRGVPWIQVPTTLVAQVDSSIGGKTGVDLPEGKNLVGAFHQPAAIVIDVAALAAAPRAPAAGGAGRGREDGGARRRGAVRDARGGRRGDRARRRGGVRVGRGRRGRRAAGVGEGRGRDAPTSASTARPAGGSRSTSGTPSAHALEAADGYATLLHGEAVALRAARRGADRRWRSA